MKKNCQTCKFFNKIDDRYGRCNCPEAGGGHSLIVEIMENCEFFAQNIENGTVNVSKEDQSHNTHITEK